MGRGWSKKKKIWKGNESIVFFVFFSPAGSTFRGELAYNCFVCKGATCNATVLVWSCELRTPLKYILYIIIRPGRYGNNTTVHICTYMLAALFSCGKYQIRQQQQSLTGIPVRQEGRQKWLKHPPPPPYHRPSSSPSPSASQAKTEIQIESKKKERRRSGVTISNCPPPSLPPSGRMA